MNGAVAAGLLSTITAAVTPVILISAAASLILSINQKHNGLSERLRTLAQEFRHADTSAQRRRVIRQQVCLFERRFHYISVAHVCLYASVICFLLMILDIALMPRLQLWDRAGIGLFAIGMVLVLFSAVQVLVELRFSRATIELELQDVLKEEGEAG